MAMSILARAPLLRAHMQHSLRAGHPTWGALPRRYASTSILSAVLKVLRLRYLALGSAVGGGYAVSQKYEDFKNSIPDYGKLADYLPSSDKVSATFEGARSRWSDWSGKSAAWRERFSNVTDMKFIAVKDWFGKSTGAISGALEIMTQRKALLLAGEDQRTHDEETGQTNNAELRSSATATSHDGHVRAGAAQASSAATMGTAEFQEELMKIQMQYQKEIEKLERENRELRKQNLLRQNRNSSVKLKQIKKSLIDMYSEVLDELADFDHAFSSSAHVASLADNLPRVVVVGDQSAGKTSVLEMVAQARIFPRGAGEMMTRCPVKVTLSEGPYHVARFNDSSREFDLTKESELAALRKEIEIRMKSSVAGGRSISTQTISLSVQGPGLQRMVLVDLPGIISTVTRDMPEDTKDAIRQLARQHLENPNAIILCIQDGSIDAERSNVTDLVSSVDPQGKRTIFVLTKFDLAEMNLFNPERIKKILEGRLFPMKALGYFAVITGKGNKDDNIQSIHEYEEQFFRNSKLFHQGVLKASQTTTKNLSKAVSERFWKMVKESAEQQADAYKAIRYNLETEWKNTFPHQREQDRDELCERARGEILDELVHLSTLSPATWENTFSAGLWRAISDYIFEKVTLPASETPNLGTYQTMVDIRLREWTEQELPQVTVSVGWNALYNQLKTIQERAISDRNHDDIFDKLKEAVREASFKRHQWDDKAANSLRVIQTAALEERTIHTKAQWDVAVKFMEKTVTERLKQVEQQLYLLAGPGTKEQWLHWRSRSPIQKNRVAVISELQKLLETYPKHGINLPVDELTTVRKNMQAKNVEVDNDFIRETWQPVYRRHYLQRMLAKCQECRSGFYHYQQGFHQTPDMDCREVILFWRLHRTLEASSNALRQQVMNSEIRRLEKIMRDVLEECYEDSNRLSQLLVGKRVQLAEDLKKVRQIQEKLEEFVRALNNERN